VFAAAAASIGRIPQSGRNRVCPRSSWLTSRHSEKRPPHEMSYSTGATLLYADSSRQESFGRSRIFPQNGDCFPQKLRCLRGKTWILRRVDTQSG